MNPSDFDNKIIIKAALVLYVEFTIRDTFNYQIFHSPVISICNDAPCIFVAI